MQVVLYSFRRCPYAMRARMALHVAQIQFEHREIELKAKPQHLLAISPKGTVPVLWIKEDGRELVVDQSLGIMKWSLEKYDPENWLLHSQEIKDQMFALIEKNDLLFKPDLDRYKYPHRFGLSDALPHRSAGLLFLEELEMLLKRHDFLMGSQISMADVAIMPFVRQFARVDWSWFVSLPLERLSAWLVAFERSDLFTSIMARPALWNESPNTH